MQPTCDFDCTNCISGDLQYQQEIKMFRKEKIKKSKKLIWGIKTMG